MASDQNSDHGQVDDSLAYGDYDGEEGERGLIGDTYRKLRGRPKPQQGTDPNVNGGPGTSSGLGSFVFDKLHGAVHDIGSELTQRLGGRGQHSHTHTHSGTQCAHGMHDNSQHRFGSFAPKRTGNDVKWFVDGCGYMWAVSRALEQAVQSIWILDCMYLLLSLLFQETLAGLQDDSTINLWPLQRQAD